MSNPHALPEGVAYGTPTHLSVTEQAGLAAYKAYHLNKRFPTHLFMAAPYAWAENGNTPTRWGVQYLGTERARAGAFVANDWGYGPEAPAGLIESMLRDTMAGR